MNTFLKANGFKQLAYELHLCSFHFVKFTFISLRYLPRKNDLILYIFKIKTNTMQNQIDDFFFRVLVVRRPTE